MIQDFDFYCEVNHIHLFLSLHFFNHVVTANVLKPLQSLFWCLLKAATHTSPIPALGWGSETWLHTLEENGNCSPSPQSPTKHSRLAGGPGFLRTGALVRD